MKRSFALCAAVGLGVCAAGALVHAASCTVFDGLVAESDAGSDGSEADADADDKPESDSGTGLTGYLALEDAARLCAYITECPNLAASIISSLGLPLDGSNASVCATWLAGPIPPNRPGFALQQEVLREMATASSCIAAAQPLPLEFIEADDERCTGASGYQCLSADRDVINCDLGFIQHCASSKFGAGSECRIGLEEIGRCALQSCLGDTGADCKDDVSIFCDPSGSQLRLQFDCTFNGLRCGDGSGAGAYCGTAEGALTCEPAEFGQGSCNGDVLRVCNGVELIDFDCTDLGGTCDPANPTAGCALPEPECSSGDTQGVNVCDGDELELCVAGKKRNVDCTKRDMTCIPAAGGNTARCATK